MKQQNFYPQPTGNNSSGFSGNRSRFSLLFSKRAIAAGLVCIASAFLGSVTADAQTSVSRTTKVIAGVSPVSDTVWTVNQNGYGIVKRLNPSIPSDDILSFNAIATDPMTGDHYAIANLNVSGLSLVTINIQTGICAFVGTLADNIKSLSFNVNGTLFGMSAGVAAATPESVYRINKSDASLTYFDGVAVDNMDGVIAYNTDNDYFYHWSGAMPDTWERFDTASFPVVEGLTTAPPITSEIIGALYDGGGNFIVSNSNNEWYNWDVAGNVSAPLVTFDGPVRGMVTESHTSEITAASAVTFCPGDSVYLVVTGGTGGYQWYRNGALLGGQTDDTLTAHMAGVYNCVYADLNAVIDSPTSGIIVGYLETPSISVNSSVAVCRGVTTATIGYNTLTNYSFSGTPYSYTVPADVTNINFDIRGAAGGRDTSMASVAAKGGRLTGSLTVTPGDMLTITTGGAGMDGMIGGMPGGSNGGGASFGPGGSGGGATDIRLNGVTLADRVAVAGGGAGAGYDEMSGMTVAGGAGGDLTGAVGGMNSEPSAASGGDQTGGGIGAVFTGFAAGGDGMLGVAGDGSTDGVSGGGGGGYYGGGGGVWSGGGGGSSYSDATLVTGTVHTQGASNGNGGANISYPIPSSYSYSITWDATALTAGFAHVTSTAFPSDPSFNITVPADAAPAIYNGVLTISNGICTSDHPITVEVKMIPTVNATTDQAVCNGVATTGVAFTGSAPTPTFNWTNSSSAIGLAASGAGDIASFTGTNITTATDSAHIIVTPELVGCFGTPDTFDVVVFPSPTLSVNPGSACNGVTFDYTAASATAGTGFVWERTSVPAGLTTANPTASGTNTISETFDNTGTDVIQVAYTFTLTANGCDNVETLNVNANPTPVLFPAPLTGSICNGGTFGFTQNSQTAGVVYSWSRAAMTGISNAASSGTGDISEVLNDTTVNPVTVVYVDTLNINGCINTQTVDVVVNPTPVLSSSLTPPSVCNNTLFTYTGTTATTGATITWSRDVVPGISSLAAVGNDGNISETHENTTDNPIAVVYDFDLTINGCINTQQVTVMVNPSTSLNTTLTPPAICDSSFFDYEPGSNTTGATFTWTRATVAGIKNGAGFGTGNPLERLENTTSASIPVTYVFTTTIDGCSNTDNVVVNVNPRPSLSNSPISFTICDSTTFTFVPASTTLGATYTWTRAFVSGIGAIPVTNGVDGINEILDNNTNTSITVPYIYTITANGCSRTQPVRVLVHPSPLLTSSLVDSACSGNPFIYEPLSTTIPAHTYAWSRAMVTGITPDNGAGTGGINETLINPSTATLDVVYVYTVTVGGTCSKSYNLNVKVRPAAAVPVIATMPSANLCSGTMYQNFGAATPAAAGNSYEWSATNAEVYAIGTGKQYSLVNFANPGTSVVTLTSSIGATGCTGIATYTVEVGSKTMETPRVIYMRNSVFMCLKNDVKSYQWGYDDATTLDSVILTGEVNQSYFEKSPDFTNRHYWVIVNNDDCMEKAYFNTPGDNTPRPDAGFVDEVNIMNVFPNPANDRVNVEVNSALSGTMSVEVSNILGQVVSKAGGDTRKVGIDITDLASGVYIVDCYLEGVKIGTAKFVKN